MNAWQSSENAYLPGTPVNKGKRKGGGLERSPQEHLLRVRMLPLVYKPPAYSFS
jgi:hypothetical protein